MRFREEIIAAWCCSCKAKCQWHWEDLGYGPYEYGSLREWHTAWTPISDCCGDEIQQYDPRDEEEDEE
jgi:hypothetical protein